MKKTLVLAVLMCAFMALSRSSAHAQAFSVASINGSCALTYVETDSSGATAAAIGIFSFDGTGVLQASTSVVAFNATNQSFVDFAQLPTNGSYTVNANGTGSLTFTPPGTGVAQTLSLVIDQVDATTHLAHEVRFLGQGSGAAGTGVCQLMTAAIAG